MPIHYMLIAVNDGDRFIIDFFTTKKAAEEEMWIVHREIDSGVHGEVADKSTIIIEELEIEDLGEEANGTQESETSEA